MNAPAFAPAFVFRSGAGPVALPEILDLWSPAAPDLAAFDVPGTPVPAEPAEPAEPVWRVTLPESPAEAEAVLQEGEARLALASAALASTPGRLATLAARLPPAGQWAGLSFDAARAAGPLDPAEAELLRWLGGAGLSSYSVGEPASADPPAAPAQAAALQQFRSLLDQLGRQLGQLAWVETVWSGELLARSLVSWGGDARTGWRGRPAPQPARAHARALALAIGSRLLWLQTAVVVVQGATRISLRLALPGGPLLAIPAIYQFVNQLAAQARRQAQLANA